MTFQGYYTPTKVAHLQDAFSTVQDPKDWRGPIKAEVRPCDLADVVEAIEFFTATAATVKPVSRADGVVFLVESVGYRAGPAGDH
jgi:hypothetical protein